MCVDFLQKEKLLCLSTILSAVINIVLNFILIPRYQESAAAFTTIIRRSMCMCNIRIRVKKNHKDQLHSKKSDLNDHWLCGDCDLLYAGCKSY